MRSCELLRDHRPADLPVFDVKCDLAVALEVVPSRFRHRLELESLPEGCVL